MTLIDKAEALAKCKAIAEEARTYGMPQMAMGAFACMEAVDALAPTDAADDAIRCAECDCEDGNCAWIKTHPTDAAQAREVALDAIKMGFLSAAPGEWRVSDIERVTEAILRALEQEGR